MISYVLHKIERVENVSTVSKTIRLDHDKRKILGVIAVMPSAYHDITEASLLRIGLKYNGVEILPRNFSLSLFLHRGLLPMRDTMLPTPFECSPDDENEISIDIELSTEGGMDIPSVSLYFVTEQ